MILKPIDEGTVYSRSSPTSINSKDEVKIEIRTHHKSHVSTKLKPNRVLKVVVLLRKIRNPRSDDFSNINFQISSPRDAHQDFHMDDI